MPKKAFATRIGTSRKIAAANIILVANAFIWYFYVGFLMEAITKARFSNFEVVMIWGINFLGIAVSAILGGTLIYKFRRRIPFLLYWMLAGVPLSFIPIVLNVATSIVGATVSAILGVYFGLGMPICMGYYAAATETRNRSRLGGITFFLIYLGFFLLISTGIKDILFNTLVLATWRAVGLVILVLLKPGEKKIGEKEKLSYRFVVSNKSFLLYFIPWCMFSIVNYMTVPINSKFFPENFIQYSTIIESILGATFAVIAGFIADSVGRKRLAITAFTLLGLGYAVLGLFPRNLLGWWFYTVVDGIAWGAFYTMFLITIWGDIAQERSSEKYYAVGSLPFLLSIFMRLSIGLYVAEGITESAVFSFAAFFLFLAVLPLIYAPETLPEKVMKDRELKNYIEKAQKEATKAQKKEAENTPRENAAAEVESEGEDFEEKLKEAEKYY
jgi:MFS family permease